MAKDQEVQRIAKKLDKMVNKNNTVSVSAREVQHQEAGSAGVRSGQLHFHLWRKCRNDEKSVFVSVACRIARGTLSVFMKAAI